MDRPGSINVSVVRPLLMDLLFTPLALASINPPVIHQFVSVYKVGDLPLRGPLLIPSQHSSRWLGSIETSAPYLLLPARRIHAENQYGADIQVIKVGNSCPNNILEVALGGGKGC